MKKWHPLLLLLCLLLASCAPRKPLPSQPEPTEPPQAGALQEQSLFDAAEALYVTNMYAEARNRYEAYIRQFPQGTHAASVWLRLGDIYAFLEEFDKARHAFQQVVDQFPLDPLAADAMIRKLETYLQEGRFDDAIQYSFEIQDSKLDPTQLSRKEALLGDAFLAVGSYADAFYFYSLVYSQSAGPEKEQVLAKLKKVLSYINLIHTDHLLGRLTDPVLQGYLLYHMGLLNLETNRTEYAIEALSQLIERYPEHERSEAARALLQKIFQSSIASPYTIGCVLPLSGSYNIYGNRVLRGIELAVNRYNRENPRTPVRILVKDTESNPYRAVLAVQQLDEAKAAAIIGPIIAAEPAAYEAQTRGIPILLFTQKEDITRTGDFVFRNFITPEMQIKAVTDYAVLKQGLRRFAILYPDENYGETFMKLFWDAVSSLGAVIAGVETYDPEQTDFAEPIKKLVGLYYDVPEDLKLSFEMMVPAPDETHPHTPGFADPFISYDSLMKFSDALFYQYHPPQYGPLAVIAEPGSAAEEEPEPIIDFDAVFIPDAPKKAGLIVPQLAYYDIEDVLLIGTNLWHSRNLLDMSRKYVQGAVLPDGFFADSKAPHVQAFSQDFERVFEEKPGFIEAVAYDSAGILLQILSNTDIHFRSRIKDELLNLTRFTGVTGETAFDYSGDVLRHLYLLKIRGNRFTEIETP